MGKVIFMGLIAGLGTCLGAALALLFGRLRSSSFSLLLGLAAGVMLAVVFLDLFPAALLRGRLSECLVGALTGLFFLAFLDYILYPEDAPVCSRKHYLSLGYLIASGIAIHDLPEGLAIAAGYAEPFTLGPLLTLAIGLHNIPEGMATATPLRAGGMSKAQILYINVLISLVTPLGSALGSILINLSPAFISFLMCFAGGAMSYIVLLKLIPESLRHHRPLTYSGLFLGIAFMASLNLFF